MLHNRAILLLVVLGAGVQVFADKDAEATLQAMVDAINAKTFDNNFFKGDYLEGEVTETQEVGGCLLDKAGAIQTENGVESFANDLQVDLAACCTKSDSA